MNLLLESAAKVTLILLTAMGLMPALRNRSAALRHWILATALVCAAIAPMIRLVVPAWHLPAALAPVARDARPESVDARVETALTVSIGRTPASGPPVRQERPPVERDIFPFRAPLRAIWTAGTAFGLAVLLVGLGRLGRLAFRAQPIVSGVWADRAEAIRREFGFRRPVVLLQSRHPTLLVTWGLRTPKVILPATARHWPDDRVRLVLYHELEHIRRGDWVVQLVAEVVRCVYWFNPLVWMACARLRHESEQACDDAVLGHGIEGSEYATHLVDIARELRQHRMWMPAPAIAHASSLERRIRAMLDDHRNRRPISRFACVATLLALLAVTVPVAGFVAAQTTFGTLGGSIVDPMNAALPDVTLVLTSVQNDSKYEVRSDRTGRYEFVGLAPGDYLLEARLPGFANLQRKLTLAGQNVVQDLTLQVGSVSETITVRASPEDGPSLLGSEVQKPRAGRRAEREAVACSSGGSAGIPIGGNLRPPIKLRDVRPQYPANLRDGGVGGTVVLQGRIGTDGMINDVSVVSSPHADLTTAAIDAVRQWEFDSTLLNCVPVEVAIKITVNFQSAP
jgi:TonB family protein